MAARSRLLLRLACAAVLVAAAACGGKGKSGGSGDQSGAGLVAQVASYEVVANHPQQVNLGLVRNGTSRLLAYGTVNVTFSYLGTREHPVQPPGPGPKTTAHFRPIPGQKLAGVATKTPQLVDPSTAIGVYGTEPVEFPSAGFYGVTVTATVGGKPARATAVLTVYDQPRIPFPGQPAPRTANPIEGAAGVDPAAIDSRAKDGAAIPDRELHSTSIADAIAAGKPLMVVVSTPVYCQSRFCGPITDSVEGLAKKYGDRMAFVHLEVWQDFDKKALNPAAAEWMTPKGDPNADLQEPWVFTVGRDGVIVDRFDDVATDAELEAAVKRFVT